MEIARRVPVLAWVGVFAAAFAGPAARGQDLSPKIDHQPVKAPTKDGAVTIRARIVTATGKAVYDPTVYFRVPGISGFSRAAMRPAAGTRDLFVADIPATLVAGDFDYYIEAFDADGNGPGHVGSADQPLHVGVGAGVPPPPQRATGQDAALTPPPAAPGPLLEGKKLEFPPGEDPRQMSSGVGFIVAGAILGGLGTLALAAGLQSIATGPGVVATILGGALLATGIPLLIVGIVRNVARRRAMKAAGLSFGFDPRTRSTLVAYTFEF